MSAETNDAHESTPEALALAVRDAVAALNERLLAAGTAGLRCELRLTETAVPDQMSARYTRVMLDGVYQQIALPKSAPPPAAHKRK